MYDQITNIVAVTNSHLQKAISKTLRTRLSTFLFLQTRKKNVFFFGTMFHIYATKEPATSAN
jgi:hypothetical protein